MYEDYFYTAQALNVRKFSPDGQQFYNFTDTTKKQNTYMSLFPIDTDKNDNPIVIQTIKSVNGSKTVLNKYNSQGKFLMTTDIDSTMNTYDPIAEEWVSKETFVVQGFKYGVNDINYCYGERNVRIKLGEYVSDTLSSYVMAVDTNGLLLWKNIFYSGILTGCYPLKDGGAIFVGLDINTYVAKFNPQGELIWKKFFGADGYQKWPIKIIETSNEEFFVVGRSQSKGQTDTDKYIAKLDKDGLLLWEDKSGLPFNERYHNITEYAPNKYYITDVSPGYISVHRFEDDLSDVVEERDNNLDFELTVAPNPVENILSIYSNIEFDSVEIYSILGLKVLETDLKERIDVSDLLPGMYFIKIGNTYDKFIKQR